MRSSRYAIGLAEQLAVRVEQPVVDAPRVDADRLDLRIPAGERREAGEHLARTGRVRFQRRWPSTVGGRVGEAMHDVELDRVAVDDAGDHPAARRAEVDRCEDACGHRQRRNAAATPASTGTSRPVVWLNSSDVDARRRTGDVLGQHLALQQRALRVERAELLLRHAVDGGALRAPPAGEDAAAPHDAIGVDAVDPDAVLAELGREQPHLVRLVGLGRAVRRRCSGPANTAFFDTM